MNIWVAGEHYAVWLENLREQLQEHAAAEGLRNLRAKVQEVYDPALDVWASRSAHLERGPSAAAVAKAREPWRPTIDEWDLLPSAEEGWRR